MEKELADKIDTLERVMRVPEQEMARNPAAFARVDTKNMAGRTQSLGALVVAAAVPVADKQKRAIGPWKGMPPYWSRRMQIVSRKHSLCWFKPPHSAQQMQTG